MKRTLLLRTLRDSWLLLTCCCGMLITFMVFRVWVAAQIDINAFETMVAAGLAEFIGKLLPVPFDVLATPAGRVAFGYEELPVIILGGLWAVSRGSECIAGRQDDGTMEMLLAQPIRRISIVGSHATITLAGCAVIGLASWIGSGLGIVVAQFEQPPAWRLFVPASINLIGLCTFTAGLATLLSACARTRSQAVGLTIGFYVVQLMLLIVSMLSPQFVWMQWTTFLTAYDPTVLTVGLAKEPELHWPLFWQYNAVLYGLGAVLLASAAALFCSRDVRAPV